VHGAAAPAAARSGARGFTASALSARQIETRDATPRAASWLQARGRAARRTM
jgi:hypothetical protein